MCMYVQQSLDQKNTAYPQLTSREILMTVSLVILADIVILCPDLAIVRHNAEVAGC